MSFTLTYKPVKTSPYKYAISDNLYRDINLLLIYTRFLQAPWGHFGVPVYHPHAKMAFLCGRDPFQCTCRFINSTHFIISNCDPSGFIDPDLVSFIPVTRQRSSSSYILHRLTSSQSSVTSQPVTTQSSTLHHGPSSSTVIIATVTAFIALAIAIAASSILIKVIIFPYYSNLNLTKWSITTVNKHVYLPLLPYHLYCFTRSVCT